MEDLRHLTPDDDTYPDRIRAIAKPPQHLSIRGRLDSTFSVAIVGARNARDDAARYAEELAKTLGTMGIVVISGGAVGIDAAAHRGAIAAGGRTWAVAGTGSNGVSPLANAVLFDRIVESGGAMIWPFKPTQPPGYHTFLSRNRVLVALADAVVVVQAGIPSGALNAAAYARRFGRPLWIVPGLPWTPGFEGGAALLERARDDERVHALTSTDLFLESLGQKLTPKIRARHTAIATLTGAERAIAEATSREPRHIDELAAAAGLSAGAAATALLTLALEDVVVEGPGGFFRRAEP